jgi:hypothetical protein
MMCNIAIRLRCPEDSTLISLSSAGAASVIRLGSGMQNYITDMRGVQNVRTYGGFLCSYDVMMS